MNDLSEVPAPFATFLRAMPKTDLHCHIVGTLRKETLAELAAKHDIPLPRPPAELYDFKDFYVFIDTLRLAATVMRDREDFAKVAYEALEDGHRVGNLVHAEFMFNPQYFYPNGIDYRSMTDGLIDGIRAAKKDFGTSALLIPSLDRQITKSGAMEIAEHIVSYIPDEVAGIGLDGPERAGPPEMFVDVYALARRHGLRATAHVCEDNQTLEEAPPANYYTCRDRLHCDRLDHGYNILSNAQAVRAAREDGLFFNTCTITSAAHNLEKRRNSIRAMREQGLRVTINTDDPVMFKTDIEHSFELLFAAHGWGWVEAKELALNGIEASWLDDSAKDSLKAGLADVFRKHELPPKA